MADSFANLLSPGTQAVFNFGLNTATAAVTKSAGARQAWQQWETETVTAIQKGVRQDQENFRAFSVDLENWFRQSQYVEEMRQFELTKQQQSAELKTATSISALKDFERRVADLDAQYYEQEAAGIIQLEALRTKQVASAASAVAGGQVGRTVERIRNSYHQQWLQNASNRQITRQFRIADKIVAGEAAAIDAKNKTNSVTLYNARPFADPVKPLSPLPTEVYTSKEPTVSGALSFLDVAGLAMGSIQHYKGNMPPSTTTTINKKEKEKPKASDKPAEQPQQQQQSQESSGESK